MTTSAVRHRPLPASDGQLFVDDPEHALLGAARLAKGAVVAHGFANFYAITARGDAATIRRVNRLTGRPLTQAGSMTAPAERIAGLFDRTRLPRSLSYGLVQEIVDAFLLLGPFGFRGPARDDVEPLLTAPAGAVPTTRVISPGYACASNQFLSAAADTVGTDHLYVTSATRSRHASGAAEAPAHWRAGPLAEEFGQPAPLLLLRHSDDRRALLNYPLHRPMSTTIIGLHRTVDLDGRTALVLERHGSLHADAVRAVLADFDLGLVTAPSAQRRLTVREYAPAGRPATSTRGPVRRKRHLGALTG